MLGIALALLLSAPESTPPPPEDLTLAAPPFDAHKLPKKEVAYFSEHFSQRLAAHGLQVLSPQQISSVPELEQLRKLLGCPETSVDCIIELGRMLRVKGVVRGTMAKLDDLYVVDIRVFQSSDGKVIAAKSARARTSETLVANMDKLAQEVAEAVRKALAPTPVPKPKDKYALEMPPPPILRKTPPPPPPPPINWRGMWWIPAAVGGAAGGGSGFFLFQAEQARGELRSGSPTFADAQNIRAQGEMNARIGTGMAIGAGAALLAAGGLLLFAPAGKPGTPAVVPGPTGVKVEVAFQ